MSTINDIPAIPIYAICNFGWVSLGPPYQYVEEGVSYPPPAPSGFPTVYQSNVTPLNTPITFYATDAASLGLPKITVPTGLTIVQYTWLFGDGTTGYGPTTSHTYKVLIPGARITLRVIDNLGRQYSSMQALNLYYTVGASGAAYRVRRSS